MKSAENENRAEEQFQSTPVSFRCGSKNVGAFAICKGLQRIQSTLVVRSSRAGYAINESSDNYTYDDNGGGGGGGGGGERRHRARNADTIVQYSENIKPLKSQTSASILESGRNSEKKTIAFNPFVNCPPLTSDVDTGRSVNQILENKQSYTKVMIMVMVLAGS